MPALGGPNSFPDDLLAHVNEQRHPSGSVNDMQRRIRLLEAALAAKDKIITSQKKAIKYQYGEIKRLVGLKARVNAIIHERDAVSYHSGIDAKQFSCKPQGEIIKCTEGFQGQKQEQEEEMRSLRVLNAQLFDENDALCVQQGSLLNKVSEAVGHHHTARFELRRVCKLFEKENNALVVANDRLEMDIRDQDMVIATLEEDHALMRKALMQVWGEKECGKSSTKSGKQKYRYKHAT